MDIVTQRLSHAQAPAVKLWFLDPSNNPVRLSIRANINNGVTYIRNGRVLIDPKAADAGWRYMEPQCTKEEWAVWTAFSDQCDKQRTERPPESMLPKCIRRVNDHERKAPFVPTTAAVESVAAPVVDLPDTPMVAEPPLRVASGEVTVDGKSQKGRAAGALSRKGPSEPDGSEDAL